MNDNKSPIYYNRKIELEEFENTKLGVKGLVDSGITRIPRIFHHLPETLTQLSNHDHEPIPIIDLSGPEPDVVNRVREASVKFGFFQVVNHGVPVRLLNRLVNAVKGFHELPATEKMKYYGRETVNKATGVGFYSNHDLFLSKALSWRDTLSIRLGPDPLDPGFIPDCCREEVLEWDKEVQQLGDRLMELLSKGVGLASDKLKGMAYLGRRAMVGQYYPYCPEPNKTNGIGVHTDPGLLTVLLQDQVGGLQVSYQGKWLDLKPVHGALVVNIGDLFQMITNDEYRSGEHRVVANSEHEPRVSIAVFFSPGISNNLYGPLPELVSIEKPAMYQQFKFSDFLTRFFAKDLDGKPMTNYFRVVDQ